ncbi:trypsin-like peptidase domain-containing protein [Dactylosporangium sp. NPDC050688]|uniref:trypsin-like peptidase domain-containing protein n=1 Tax=Dactylosporangium sp. NPDC050688 TaxID=3157217 RepID=UPI003402DF3C
MSDEDRQWSAPPTAARPATPGQPPGEQGSPGAHGSPGTSELPVPSPAGAPAEPSESPAWARPAGEPRPGAGSTAQVPAGPFPPAPGTPTWPATQRTGGFPASGAPAAGPTTGIPGTGAHGPVTGAHGPATGAPGSGSGSTTAAFPAVTAPGPVSGQPGYTGQHSTNGHPYTGHHAYHGAYGNAPAQPGYGPTPQPGYGPTPQPGYGQAQPVRGGRVAGLIVAAVAIAVVSAFGGGLVATNFAKSGDGPTTVITRNAAPNLERSSVGAVAEAVLPSVVDITTGEGEGSGVIMTADGTIITNNHVVAGATKLTVTFSNGKTASATLVGADPAGDIAVIKAQNVSGLTAAKFGDSDALRVGDTVLAVGSPLGLQGSVTAGIVSALHRTISSGEQGGKSIADAIQTDAAINPGNSGGALVNLAGEVVGINTAILTAGQDSNGNIGVGFAISANRARSAADQLAKGGKVSHPYLGVQLGDGQNGALIGGVVAAGPADKAGIKTGDLVTKIGNTPINGATDLINAVQAAKVGDRLTMTIQRNGAEQQVTVTLGESP